MLDKVVKRFVHKSLEFTCGSCLETPVDWMFGEEKTCIYCSGVLTYAHIGHYVVNKIITGNCTMYTLHIKNILMNDFGIYTCIEDAGFGEQASAALIKIGKKTNKLIIFCIQC